MCEFLSIEPEISVRAVGKAFGDQVVLRDVEFDIMPGDMVAIVGASGTGKTVLLDTLSGLMRPDSGTVCARDHSKPDRPLVDIHAQEWEALDNLRLHWAIVFQRNALFSGTVHDNIALWLREHTELSEEDINARVRDSLQAAALDPDEVQFKNREELSGGMGKRVAIARAIAVDPRVIFYDEPTTGLDPMSSGHIHTLLFEFHGRPLSDGSPRTTLFVTHDKDLLRRVRPRVIMLHEAGVCFDGPYGDFLRSREPAVRDYLQSMPVLNARA